MPITREQCENLQVGTIRDFCNEEKCAFARTIANFFFQNFQTNNLLINARKDAITFKYIENTRLFFAIKPGKIEIYFGEQINNDYLLPEGTQGQHRILKQDVLEMLNAPDGNQNLRNYIQDSYAYCGGLNRGNILVNDLAIKSPLDSKKN